MTNSKTMSLGQALKSAGMEIVSVNGKAARTADEMIAAERKGDKPAPVKRYCCPYCAAGERCGFLGMR